MIIDTTLSADPEIIKGLLNGTLKRFGGVIRCAATGQIRKHLLEPENLTQHLINFPFSPILGGAKLAVDVIGQGITINKLNKQVF